MLVSSKPCPTCGDTMLFTATIEQLRKFAQGALVQDVFPDMPAGDRERLISGTCPPCWDKMWKESEND